MNNNLLIFLIFWGAWILIPIAVDGVYALIQVIVILIRGQKPKLQAYRLATDKMPLVSIVIPTYNEEQNVDECLNFLKTQTYPHQSIEVIIVDNGSSDRTSQIVQEHIAENRVHPSYNGQEQKIQHNGQTYPLTNHFRKIALINYQRQNKAHALNIGLEQAQGEIVLNIDCRSRLAPDAVYNMVAYFERDPELDSCTGNVEITWRPAQLNDQNGRAVFFDDGFIQQRDTTLKEDFLAKCQFLEYLTSFRIGREFQSIHKSIYTLSGAFSAFRKSSLQNNHFYPKDQNGYLENKNAAWYSDRTVTEDTDLTLSMQNKRLKVGYAAYSKAYLKPVISWQHLYAQRVRWRRGQIEVFGLYSKIIKNREYGFFGMIMFPLTLLLDHTLALPRLIWTALFPFLVLFGYSPTIVSIAFLVICGFNIAVDFFNIMICYPIVDQETKKKIRATLHYGFLISIFRFIVFYFRISGFLIALRESPSWTITGGPVQRTKRITQKMQTWTQNIASKVYRLIQGRNNPPNPAQAPSPKKNNTPSFLEKLHSANPAPNIEQNHVDGLARNNSAPLAPNNLARDNHINDRIDGLNHK